MFCAFGYENFKYRNRFEIIKSMNNPTSKSVSYLGFYSAILTPIVTLVTFIIAFLTEPLSGPWCQSSCFSYPFLDTASRYPSDYIWMYPAMLLLVIYLVLMVSIHHGASPEKKIYSHLATLFAFGSVLIFVVDYFLQLSVIQPSLLRGEVDGISLLTQFNPHGIFIAMEEIAFILMSLSFLFMAPVFVGDRLQKSIRWVFASSFIVTVLSFLLLIFRFGINREYFFEVTAFSINWLTLVISGILLSFLFRKSMKQ